MGGDPTDEALNVLRSYDEYHHRSYKGGYRNPDIQRAFALVLKELDSKFPIVGKRYLLGTKNSGCSLGTAAALLYSDRFEYVPYEYVAKFSDIRKLHPSNRWLIDDYINNASTVSTINKSIECGRTVVIKSCPIGAVMAASYSPLHVMLSFRWDKPFKKAIDLE